MDYENTITQILMKKRWTVKKAVKEIYKKHRREFQLREIVWTAQRFNLVKLGYDETIWLRRLIADFFGIDEKSIPRKNLDSKRARDEKKNLMSISREARKKRKLVRKAKD